MRLPTSTSIFLLLLSSANPEPGAQPAASPGAGQTDQLTGVEQELVTRYLLSRLLHNKDQAASDRSDQDSASSIVYPQVTKYTINIHHTTIIITPPPPTLLPYS